MYHDGCVPSSWRFTFPDGVWLCCPCLVLSAREFLGPDIVAGPSRWRLSRRAEVLAEQALLVRSYVGAPASVSAVELVSDAETSPSDVRVEDSCGPLAIRASKRRRVRRLDRRFFPVSALAGPLCQGPLFVAACSGLSVHAPWYWERAVHLVIDGGARHPGALVDWDLLFRRLLALAVSLPSGFSSHALMFAGSFLHRCRDFGLTGTPLAFPLSLRGPVLAVGSGSDMSVSPRSSSSSRSGGASVVGCPSFSSSPRASVDGGPSDMKFSSSSPSCSRQSSTSVTSKLI